MTSSPITIKQLNNLGERLRKGQPNARDLQELDAFRRSFGSAYEHVIGELQKHGFRPSGRGSKTTESIVAKLKREKTRLSKMQDIAGCRVVVDNVFEQDEAIKDIVGTFAGCEVRDRRAKPSHGYRAVHIIAKVEGFDVEIQVRTSLQDTWAQLSEKLSDRDPEIKYGGGSLERQQLLIKVSSNLESFEDTEKRFHALEPLVSKSRRDAIAEIKRDMDNLKQGLQELMGETMIRLTE